MTAAARFTIIESPFAAPTVPERERNVEYVRAAMRDCFLRGEIPLASHALYTLPGVLRDDDPDERRMGMEAGFALTRVLAQYAEAVLDETYSVVMAVYEDFGVSPGMEAGIARAEALNLTVEHRRLPSENPTGGSMIRTARPGRVPGCRWILK